VQGLWRRRLRGVPAAWPVQAARCRARGDVVRVRARERDAHDNAAVQAEHHDVRGGVPAALADLPRAVTERSRLRGAAGRARSAAGGGSVGRL